MIVMRELRRRARYVMAPAFCCLLVVYFIYHMIQGDHGVIAWRHLDSRIVEAEGQLAALETQRGALEKRVMSLRPGSLDPDMIEEQGRRMLNFSHPDDILIIKPAD